MSDWPDPRLTDAEDALRLALTWVPAKHAAASTQALETFLTLVANLGETVVRLRARLVELETERRAVSREARTDEA